MAPESNAAQATSDGTSAAGPAARGGRQIPKLATGIPGFDLIAAGGLPAHRTTLVVGSAGSAKTVLAAQFLAEGIRRGENGVFVTFEESPADIRRNVSGLGWDVNRWEAEGKWVFVDAAPEPGLTVTVAGHYDLGALLARVEHAVRKSGAKRVSLDSLTAFLAQFGGSPQIRQEIFRVTASLKKMNVTAVLTAERADEPAESMHCGIEEFVAD